MMPCIRGDTSTRTHTRTIDAANTPSYSMPRTQNTRVGTSAILRRLRGAMRKTIRSSQHAHIQHHTSISSCVSLHARNNESETACRAQSVCVQSRQRRRDAFSSHVQCVVQRTQTSVTIMTIFPKTASVCAIRNATSISRILSGAQYLHPNTLRQIDWISAAWRLHTRTYHRAGFVVVCVCVCWS